MIVNHLRIKFIGNPDDMNYFDLVPCQLIMQEAQQRLEPIINTLLWIKGEGFEQYFEVRDEYATYDMDVAIRELRKVRRGGNPALTAEQAEEIKTALNSLSPTSYGDKVRIYIRSLYQHHRQDLSGGGLHNCSRPHHSHHRRIA
jgi:hypothetical protein